MPTDLDPVHRILLERIPQTGDARPVLLALLRVYHAGIDAELELNAIATYLDLVLDNPPWSIAGGPHWIEKTADRLEHLAREVRRAQEVLTNAATNWKLFIPPAEESADVSVRPGWGGSSEVPNRLFTLASGSHSQNGRRW